MLIRREMLAACLPATDKLGGRFALDHIQIRPDGSVVATNGSIALVAADTNRLPDEDFPVVAGAEFHGDLKTPALMPATTAKRLIASTPKKSAIPVLSTIRIGRNNGNPKTALCAATDLQVPMVATIESDAPYPDVDRVIPAADKAGTVPLILSTDVLRALLAAATAIKHKRIQTIRFDVPTGKRDQGAHGEINSAIRIRFSGADITVTGVIMPCRE